MTRAEVQQLLDAQRARERETDRVATRIEMEKYRRKYVPIAIEKTRFKLERLYAEAERLGVAV